MRDGTCGHDTSLVSSGGSRPGGVHLDTADTLAIDGSDLDVTLITPGGAPRIPDNIVVLAILGTISNSDDGVVKLSTTVLGVENTALVGLEHQLIGFDSYRDWLLGNSGLQVLDGVGWDLRVRGNIDLTLGLIWGAVTSLLGGTRDVWVVSRELESVVLGVEETGPLPATVASETKGAGSGLLVGEGEQLTAGDGMSTLDGASGGEGPAGTASTLVLDWVDGTLGSPVDGVRQVAGIELLEVHVLVLSDLVTEKLLVLLIGPGGELVVAENEAGLLVVVLLNLGILGGEDLHSELVLLLGGEGETLVIEVSVELGLHWVNLSVVVAELGVGTHESGGFADRQHKK